ncbi:MAG: hypothetical protein ACTSR2_00795 [Candidatus Hodarchaeales archaeon]
MSEEEVLKLSDEDMNYLAEKMMEGFDFWNSLAYAVELLKEKQVKSK